MEKIQRLESLGEIYELFGDLLPDRLLSKSEEGPNSRERILTPKVTFWAFVSQVLDVASSCRDVVRKVEAWWRWMRKDRTGEPAPTWVAVYRGSLGAATPAQGYFIAILLVLFALTLFGLFIFSRRS
jgi:hypothetical protein